MPKIIKSYSSKKVIYTLQKEEKKTIYFDNELELKKKEKIKEEEIYNIREIKTKLNSIMIKELELNEKEMKLKDKEIYLQKEYDELKKRKENINIINKEKEENLISILIRDVNEEINFPIVCSKMDEFVKIEELIYEKYPKFKETENYFLCNGAKINRFKTLVENRIHDGDIITLFWDY